MFLVFLSLHEDFWFDANGSSQMVRGSKRQASAIYSVLVKVMSEIQFTLFIFKYVIKVSDVKHLGHGSN